MREHEVWSMFEFMLRAGRVVELLIAHRDAVVLMAMLYGAPALPAGHDSEQKQGG